MLSSTTTRCPPICRRRWRHPSGRKAMMSCAGPWRFRLDQQPRRMAADRRDDLARGQKRGSGRAPRLERSLSDSSGRPRHERPVIVYLHVVEIAVDLHARPNPFVPATDRILLLARDWRRGDLDHRAGQLIERCGTMSSDCSKPSVARMRILACEMSEMRAPG